jgi:hypothetical protein
MSCPTPHHCPLCDPEMARVANLARNPTEYAKWLTQRTEEAQRHLARHALKGERPRSPLLLRTHVTDNAPANRSGVPAAPSLADSLRRQAAVNATTKGHKKS